MLARLDQSSFFLDDALAAVGEAELSVVELDAGSTVPLRAVTWVECDDFAAFDHGLREDDTLAEWTVLTDAGDRRLYDFHYPESVPDVGLYDAVVEHDAVHLESRNEDGEWTSRFLFSSRDDLRGFCDAHERAGVPVSVAAVYSDHEGTADAFHLTARQRKTLRAALDDGFFEVPRRTSLVALSEEFGVSEQAVSERLRRGVDTVLDATLGGDADGIRDWRAPGSIAPTDDRE
jgi:predicted DNA binding protein